MESEGAPRHIESLTARFSGQALVGAGTVLSVKDLHDAEVAGASFFVSPHWEPDLSDTARALGLSLIPGVLTPSEVMRAHAAGWRILKLFPAHLGGPRYLRSLREPMKDIGFIPTGGVNDLNIGDYVAAGAVAVGLGSWLVDPNLGPEGTRERARRARAAFAGTPVNQ